MKSVYKTTIDSQDGGRPATGEKLRSTNRSFRASNDDKKYINSHRSFLGKNRKNSVESDLYSGINR